MFFYSASLFFFIIVKSQNESNKLNFEIKQIINGQSKLPNMELILTLGLVIESILNRKKRHVFTRSKRPSKAKLFLGLYQKSKPVT